MNVHSLLDKVIHTLAGIGIFSVFIFSCLSIAVNIASPHTYHVTDLLDNWEVAHGFVLNKGQVLEDVIKEADGKMYHNKRILKHLL